MGEVRVKAKLTNAVDEALVRRGMLKPEEVRTYKADALVDSGAVRCVLPPHVVERLAEYADGRLDAVGLTEAFTLKILDREEVENALVLGDEVIIGQTALEKLDLVVDCVNRRSDQPVSEIK